MFKNRDGKFKFDFILIIAFLTSLVFIYATYAWFSASLNVTISEFTLKSESENGLFISLDGITWSDKIEITKNGMLDLLSKTYPYHITQWTNGLYTTSTAGIKDSDSDKFEFYGLKHSYYGNKKLYNKYDFIKLNEDDVNDDSNFFAFDVFFKNTTPSPYSDNLYFDKGTQIVKSQNILSDEQNYDDSETNMILSALRIGIIFMDPISITSSINRIQSSTCNNKCKSVIYEPYSTYHTDQSIRYLKKHDIEISNGDFYPTYALIKSGDDIPIWDGIEKKNNSIDKEYFKLQNTITSFAKPIFKFPNSIVKARVYIWLEGQDVDILEKSTSDNKVSVSLNFRKDNASLE